MTPKSKATNGPKWNVVIKERVEDERPIIAAHAKYLAAMHAAHIAMRTLSTYPSTANHQDWESKEMERQLAHKHFEESVFRFCPYSVPSQKTQ